MQITLNLHRENESDTTVFFTLTDDENTYKWHCDIQQTGMTEAEIQTWLEANIEKLRCGIYRKIYKEAIIEKQNGETDLQSWQRWIAAGCKNITVIKDAEGNDIETETVIATAAWKNTH